MRAVIIQIKNRFEEPIDAINTSIMDFPSTVEVGYEFWSNNISDDSKSGLYRVIEVM